MLLWTSIRNVTKSSVNHYWFIDFIAGVISLADILSFHRTVYITDGFTEDDEHLMKAKINFTANVVGDHPNVLKFIGAVIGDHASKK